MAEKIIIEGGKTRAPKSMRRSRPEVHKDASHPVTVTIDGLETDEETGKYKVTIVTPPSSEFASEVREEFSVGPNGGAGEFIYLAPDRVRWDFRKPDSMVVLFASDSVTTFHPRQQLAEALEARQGELGELMSAEMGMPMDMDMNGSGNARWS